jgi:hypothetical protein
MTFVSATAALFTLPLLESFAGGFADSISTA